MKMTMRQRLDLNLPKRDWREGWMGDTDIPSHPEMPDVTIGFHKQVSVPTPPPEDEDEEVAIARKEREKAANDLVIQDLARRLGVPVHFLHIDGFARRVLQVGHELQHVQQQRDGMGGTRNQDKREFLAFSWEGPEPEENGSGHLADATRRDVIDAALGYFNCLTADDQRAFVTKQAELLRRREAVNGTRGNASTEPPRECRRQR